MDTTRVEQGTLFRSPSRAPRRRRGFLPQCELPLKFDTPPGLTAFLNGVQALEGEGTVQVEIGSQDKCATVVVSDTGRGISPQNLSNIFRPFYTTKGNGRFRWMMHGASCMATSSNTTTPA